jgi:hypothetical protein
VKTQLGQLGEISCLSGKAVNVPERAKLSLFRRTILDL